MNKLFSIFLYFFAVWKYVLMQRVLIVFVYPSTSHFLLGNSLGKGLAKAGLDVTLISTFEDKNPPKNFKSIAITEIFKQFDDNQVSGINYNLFDWEKNSPFKSISGLNFLSNIIVKKTFAHPNFQNFLKLNESFDAIILEPFSSFGLKYLSYHFKAPLILFSGVGPTKWVNIPVGNPEPPSYIPDFFARYTSRMTFAERTYNFLYWIYSVITLHELEYRSHEALVKKYFPNSPDFDQIAFNVSLVLLNSHESINQPVPHVPNMIDIGGFHLDSAKKELPRKLKEFMDNATEGVIYFSLGTNLLPSRMPNSTLQTLLKILGTRREKIVWKYDQNYIPGQPKNFFVANWFPQKEVLSHPNTKLFITHCGQSSIMEAVYFGIPIVGLPVFGDQKLNAAHAAHIGIGKTIRFSEVNERNFALALDDALNNPRYLKNVIKRSELLHDRPMRPMDVATYWVKYVIRYKGAYHLRVAAINLSWYQYLMLDVIAFLLATVTTTLYISFKIVKFVFGTMQTTKLKIN